MIQALGDRVLEVGREQAEGREGAGVPWEDGALHLHLVRDRGGVLTACAPKGDQHEVTRIGPAFHRHIANGFGEVRSDDPVDARGGLLDAQAELVGDRGQGGNGLRPVESKLSSE